MRSEMEEPINEKLQGTAKYEKLEKLTGHPNNERLHKTGKRQLI